MSIHMKAKVEICRFLDEIFLFWNENRDLSFLDILNKVRKALEENKSINVDFDQISDQDFLVLLKECLNSLRDEKES